MLPHFKMPSLSQSLVTTGYGPILPLTAVHSISCMRMPPRISLVADVIQMSVTFLPDVIMSSFLGISVSMADPRCFLSASANMLQAMGSPWPAWNVLTLLQWGFLGYGTCRHITTRDDLDASSSHLMVPLLLLLPRHRLPCQHCRRCCHCSSSSSSSFSTAWLPAEGQH